MENSSLDHIDLEKVNALKAQLPPDEILYTLADFFKIFGDSTRIKILYALFTAEMCVHDLAYSLDLTQSAVSHQLRLLRQYRIVRFRKEGKHIYYSLKDKHIKHIFDQGLEHIHEKI